MSNRMKHSPNCECYDCTNGDAYISKLRSNYGKNANFSQAARNGVYGTTSFNNYDSHFLPDEGGTQASKLDIKKILGDAAGNVVGDLIQAKKDGQVLPKLLDKVATLGMKTEQAAVNAAQGKASTAIGSKVLQFSPYIFGGVIAVVLFFMFKPR